jgi:hypothetical protein
VHTNIGLDLERNWKFISADFDEVTGPWGGPLALRFPGSKSHAYLLRINNRCERGSWFTDASISFIGDIMLVLWSL